MTRTTCLLASVFLSYIPALAQSWSGYLVDSKCYAAMERNHNPQSTLMDVNTDRSAEVQYCRPTPKTSSFAVVDFNGQSYRLDTVGSAKAATLAKNHIRHVTITGEMDHGAIKVGTIAPAK